MTAHLILKTSMLLFLKQFSCLFRGFSLVGRWSDSAEAEGGRMSDRGWPQRSASIGVVIRARADHPGQLSGELDAERVASSLLALFFSFLLLL